MNKQQVLSMVIAVLATTLMGCGEGEDAIFGTTSSSKFEINQFERINNNIARIKTDYGNGKRNLNVTNLKGSFNASNSNNLPISTVLANNFEGTLDDQYIEVNNRTVTRPIYAKNSSERFDYSVTYRTLNLSGVDARDYNNFRTGIFTDLNNYTDIPNNISFPNGSVCYIPVSNSDRSFFVFNNNDLTSFNTLNSWTDAAKSRFSDNRQSSTTKLNIGLNNQQQAVQVTFFTVNNEPEYLYNGINYKNNIYETGYIKSGTSSPNENSSRGLVDCTLVNDVAADFLETQIRKFY